VLRLYQRIRARKNHQKATVAVARHLAEAAYWVLRKKEAYREPVARKPAAACPRTGKRNSIRSPLRLTK
jgi:hypothetical protein